MEIEETCCRFCLTNTEEITDIFSYTLGSNSNPTNASEFIGKLTGLKLIENDYLPRRMCTICANSLKLSFNFAQQCIESDNKLKKEEIRLKFLAVAQERLFNENSTESDDTNNPLSEDEISNNEIQNTEPSAELTMLPGTESDVKNEYTHTETSATPETPLKTLIVRTGKYQCNECMLKFTNKIKFLRHQTIHDSTKPFRCASCFQTFLKKEHLNVHLRSHKGSDEKAFSCSICDKQFYFKFLLNQHKVKHLDIEPFPCTKCSKGCLTKESLRRHMKIHDKNYNKKVHECTICKKKFGYQSALAEHIKVHTGEKPYLCSVCGKSFRQIGALHFHQRSHTGFKPFECNICQERFMSKTISKIHMLKHTKEKRFICDLCGTAFGRSNDLSAHKRTHTDEKLGLCSICGKRMRTTGQLVVHLRSHTGERPYHCGTCSRSFSTTSILKKHERIHTGERPYACVICNKAFKQNSTLKTHMNVHNPKMQRSDKKTASNKIKVKNETNPRLNSGHDLEPVLVSYTTL